jgi:hypothetical protein
MGMKRLSLLNEQRRRGKRDAKRSGASSISIHIDEIAIEEFEKADRAQIDFALRRSLSEYLMSKGALTFQSNMNQSQVPGTHNLSSSASSTDIGDCLGKAAARSLLTRKGQPNGAAMRGKR